MVNTDDSIENKTFYGRGFSGHVSAKMLFAAVFGAMVVLTGVVGAYNGGDGSEASPYQINNSADIRDLSTDSGNWGKYFIVTNDIDLAVGGSPTAAIGNSAHRFTGTFDGQGYTIRNFNLSLEYGGVGLFGYVDSGGEIRDLNVETTANGLYGAGYAGVIVGNNKGTLTNCSATGDVTTNSPFTGQYAGVLVGFNSGTITNCYATGDVTALYYAGGLVGYNGGSLTKCSATGTATASSHAGGLVGLNYGTLMNCSATGNATAGSNAGGLVGANSAGSLTNCYATGTANAIAGNYAGGLVGLNEEASITNCYATGDVTATESQAGGLVGHNEGSLTNCYATGTTTAGVFVGGLVGINYNLITITNCSATGNVTATSNSAGGLVGVNYGSLMNCYATGYVTVPDENAGGLVGNNGGSLTNCYATGTATAGSNAGGLVGYEFYGGITNCYATGTATAGSNEGGLVGLNEEASITNCYRYTGGDSDPGILITDITKFKDYDFLTGTDSDNGLQWSADIISTDADPSKTWRVFTYNVQYPIFQWQSFENGTLQVHSGPENATILFNGVSTGEVTNHTFLSEPVGVYTITVLKDGYGSASQTVTLTKDEFKYVSFMLLVQQNVPVSLTAGWNMISVPVANATITLPPEAGQIYRFNGNVYESVGDLESVSPGEGLWIAATGPCTLIFTGTALDRYTEPVSAGWNMIGSCTESVPFAGHLVSDPAGELNTQIYTYDPAGGTYVTPASCTPGYGYWISVSEDCEICLS